MGANWSIKFGQDLEGALDVSKKRKNFPLRPLMAFTEIGLARVLAANSPQRSVVVKNNPYSRHPKKPKALKLTGEYGQKSREIAYLLNPKLIDAKRNKC